MDKQKVCVITGANDGIGKLTALALAKSGFYIGMVCRNEDKAILAKQEIIHESGNQNIEYFICDLLVQKQVKNLANQLIQNYDTIDILINNAASLFHKYELTSEGVERQFAVNHIAPFYLTHLLLDTIKKSKDGRIINVASHSHYKATLDFDDLYFKHGYTGFKMYKRTKLCNILFTKELARRLVDSNVSTFSLHPGIVETGIGGKNANWFIQVAWKLIKYFKKAIPVEEGASTPIFLALEKEVKGFHGNYLYKCKPWEPDPLAKDEKLAKELWKVSLRICGIEGD
jgi:NAD(P)-dependent dehydrogenase (short-subunit alcohol dehydrogenase family)